MLIEANWVVVVMVEIAFSAVREKVEEEARGRGEGGGGVVQR